ncbi:2-hydroxyacid dehydrogenase [Botrimarina sp.]|uniref:2-hydroxyacid dehydrogenase n=1 Tax=Botrimarina sp. TaxID=2795802 RepID=UPI0032EFF111
MTNQQRLEDLVARLQSLGGVDARSARRLLSAIDSARADGPQRDKPSVVMFDAKSYDRDAFERANDDRLVIQPVEASLDADTASAAAGADAVCLFVNDRCDAPVVDALVELGVGLVALRCAGYNNVDLAACRDAGIDVVRVPAYSPHAVAEHTVALALMLNRRLHLAYLRNRTGAFVLDGLTGFDLHGKTAGVVGAGKIGRCVVRILSGFGCNVLAYDTQPDEAFASEHGARYVDLPELLANSDLVTLHLPLFKETHHLIDADAIASMKRGAMLINTSRGGLVDTRALIQGLKTGQVGAAGLDVYEEEAGIFFHDLSSQVLTDDVLGRLMSFNNVVVTSHQAFLTHEALDAIASTTIDSVLEHAAGKRGQELTHFVAAD